MQKQNRNKMKNFLIKYMMFIPGIVLLAISAGGFALAGDTNNPHDPKAVYVIDNLFPNAAMLYRKPGTDSMKLFNMDESTTVVTQYEGCLRLEISSPDVIITSDCIGELDAESLPVRKKP